MNQIIGKILLWATTWLTELNGAAWRQFYAQRCIGIGRHFGIQRLVRLAVAPLLVAVFGTSTFLEPACGQVFQFPNANPTSDSELNETTLIKTDPELESLLEKALRFEEDGNYRVATQLLQLVLDKSGDALFSHDNTIYYSLVRQVEQRLGDLPPDGLAAYRLDADPEAKALLASVRFGDQTRILSQVVRRYFISSVGDNAAQRLGSLYLERFDFVGARRMFQKSLRHPEPDVSTADVLAKIAVCELFLGDLDSAQAYADRSMQTAPDRRAARLVTQQIALAREGRVDYQSNNGRLTADWIMPLGSSQRYNVSPSVDRRMHSEQLVAKIQCYYEPQTRYRRPTDTQGHLMAGQSAFGSVVMGTRNGIENKLLKKWKLNHWRPTGMLLFLPDQVIFPTAQDVVSLKTSGLPWKSDDIRSRRLEQSMINWRSVWTHKYQLDDKTKNQNVIQRQIRVRNRRQKGRLQESARPSLEPEVQLFGDSISSQVSIVNDVLYVIEGPANDGIISRRRQPANRYFGAAVRRSRSNHLVAYDLNNGGAVLWQVPSQFNENNKKQVDDESELPDIDEQTSEFLLDGGMMGAPVGFANTILVPVNLGGAIWIYALDPQGQGRTLWQAYLCDEPSSGAQAWSAINLSIQGSDVFVATGLGVLFVLDASTGQIRFARRYNRGGVPATSMVNISRPEYGTKQFNDGWSSDTIIPSGRHLICFCSDGQRIESLDRGTGELLWYKSFKPISAKLDYILGVYDGLIYLGGTQTIAAIEIETGRLVWGGDEMFAGGHSMGRGMLTPDGIYVPVDDQIFAFPLRPESLQTQVEPSHRMNVLLGGAPVGNLFSDGDRFWVHGGNRIYALEVKEQ